MSVYKRPDQKEFSYDFRYRGRRYSGPTGATTERAAAKAEREIRERVKAQQAKSGNDITVGDAAARYFAEVGQHHANSDTTLTNLAWLESQIGRSRLLVDITDDDIAEAVAAKRNRKARPLKPATINRLVTELARKVHTRAKTIWRVEVTDINWSAHMLKEPQERVREMSPDEEAALMAALRKDYHPIVRFALLTGCRKQECLDLAWRKIDFASRQMRITGKNGKTRTVPISDGVLGLLQTERTLSDRIPQMDEKVFTFVVKRADHAPRGTRLPIEREGLNATFVRAVSKAGIVDFRFHDLRHTCATRLLRATGNLRLVKDLLGHEDMATTLKYAHVTTSDLLNAMNATENATSTSGHGGKGLGEQENQG